ncbi:uncharacterized protein [Nicotiana tomentosiformis]|uniref:uncharacterized protein n=1 Tax=Nicotiana tomentosiformis TaxID=4098 RepID=UPI00388C666A
MSVRDYSHKFNSLARYAPDIVRTMRARVHHYVDGLGDHLIRDCRVASLSDDVDISRIQAFAQTTEDLSRRIRDTRRDREQSKRARTMGSYREPRVDFRPPLHRYPPRSAGSFPPQMQGQWFDRYIQSGPGQSSGQPEGHRQERSAQMRQLTPPCTQCGKLHTGQCRQGSSACFHCGQTGHYISRCPGLGRGTPAQPSGFTVASSPSVRAPRPGPQSTQGRGRGRGGGDTSGSSGDQNRFYALTGQQDSEASPDVVTANIVADALSRKSMGSLSHVEADKVKMTKYLCKLASLQVRLVDAEGGRILVQNTAKSSFVTEVKERQHEDPELIKLRESIPQQRQPLFELTGDRVLRYQGRLCVPLTKSAHFLPVRMTYSAEDYAKLYIREIVRFHGVPLSIISDRGAQFTAYFWKSFQKGLGTQVNLSTVFHPQTDEQAERTIQTVEDMLRACVLDFKESWDDHLPLIEFAYNNSFQASIQMAPYEALHGWKCRSPIGWFEVGEAELLGPNLVQQAMEKVKLIRDRLRTAQNWQKSYADVRR